MFIGLLCLCCEEQSPGNHLSRLTGPVKSLGQGLRGGMARTSSLFHGAQFQTVSFLYGNFNVVDMWLLM